MSFVGKLHEISFYGVVATIVSICTGKASLGDLWASKLNVTSFSSFFLAFLFWACILFVPIAIIGALVTRFGDEGGEGLTFRSKNVLVILFAHIAEEIMGLFLTPIWFFVDLLKGRLGDEGKAVDYITYSIELIFFIIGFVVL